MVHKLARALYNLLPNVGIAWFKADTALGKQISQVFPCITVRAVYIGRWHFGFVKWDRED